MRWAKGGSPCIIMAETITWEHVRRGDIVLLERLSRKFLVIRKQIQIPKKKQLRKWQLMTKRKRSDREIYRAIKIFKCCAFSIKGIDKDYRKIKLSTKQKVLRFDNAKEAKIYLFLKGEE